MTKAQLYHFAGLAFNTPAGAATLGVTALTMVLCKLVPKITKAIPASLGAVTIVSILSNLLKLPVKTLADVAGASTFSGGLSVLPKIGLPSVPFAFETLAAVVPVAITMAAVGSIESLLTMQIVDGMMDDGKKGSTTRECIGQGVGNCASGLVGGIGGCALIGLSIINVQSGGGISRWSGMSMALFLAAGIVAAAPLLAAVPVSALVGVMLLVCHSTFSWSSLRLIGKIPRLDLAVIALVSIVTVQKDLAVAVLAGTIASALGFAWKQSTSITATVSEENRDSKEYNLSGPSSSVPPISSSHSSMSSQTPNGSSSTFPTLVSWTTVHSKRSRAWARSTGVEGKRWCYDTSPRTAPSCSRNITRILWPHLLLKWKAILCPILCTRFTKNLNCTIAQQLPNYSQ